MQSSTRPAFPSRRADLHSALFRLSSFRPARFMVYWATLMIIHEKQVTHKVLIHRSKIGGYWAEVPSMPGCFSQAETLPEMRRMIDDAMSERLKRHIANFKERFLKEHPNKSTMVDVAKAAEETGTLDPTSDDSEQER